MVQPSPPAAPVMGLLYGAIGCEAGTWGFLVQPAERCSAVGTAKRNGKIRGGWGASSPHRNRLLTSPRG